MWTFITLTLPKSCPPSGKLLGEFFFSFFLGLGRGCCCFAKKNHNLEISRLDECSRTIKLFVCVCVCFFLLFTLFLSQDVTRSTRKKWILKQFTRILSFGLVLFRGFLAQLAQLRHGLNNLHFWFTQVMAARSPNVRLHKALNRNCSRLVQKLFSTFMPIVT